VRALEDRDFKAAADFFRKGVQLTNGQTMLGRSLRHKLGTALFLSGDVRGAVERFEETVRHAPSTGLDEPAAKAHYSLGVLMASSGRSEESIKHLSAAASYNPTYVEALVALADALRRTGRDAASMTRYDEVLRINPRVAEARFGYAMALVRLRRYREARDWLTEAAGIHPDRGEFRQALARVLAASPDDSVRDGPRAVALVKELFSGEKTTELGETMAMSLAELGQYDEAVGIQRGVIDASSRSGQTAAARRMTANLRLYERRQPCRTPWSDDDPVYAPGPPVNPELAAALRR
jgi:tetratricopeptide (TPR) repeat protein